MILCNQFVESNVALHLSREGYEENCISTSRRFDLPLSFRVFRKLYFSCENSEHIKHFIFVSLC